MTNKEFYAGGYDNPMNNEDYMFRREITFKKINHTS